MCDCCFTPVYPGFTIFTVFFTRTCYPDISYFAADLTGIQTRFYSQDLSRYFWWFICRGEGTVESFPDSCTGKSFLELHIKDLRDPPTPNTELNLTSFPWELALQDLKDIAGVTFADPSVEYRWLGDGKTLLEFYLLLKL